MDDQTLLLTLLQTGWHQCGIALQGEGGLVAGLAVAGLAGGLSHCGAMCGPFVLSQVAGRLEAMPARRMREWHRLAGAALLPYHLGRATTYAGLGATGALLAGSLIDRSGLRWLSAALLLFAALFMLSMAIPALKRLRSRAGKGDSWWAGRIGSLAQPLFARPTGWRGYLLGILLGFIPCGLLYGALAAASASGSWILGAAAMAAFTVGTVPSLLAVGLLGHLAGQRWRAYIVHYAPLLLLLNAGMLLWLAWHHLA